MAVPKRKMSRANTRSRKARWKAKAKAPELVPVSVDGERKLVAARLAKYYRTLGR